MPRSLSRKTAHRKSTLRNLAASLVLYEKIITTESRAKEVKSIVEHLINQSKTNDLISRRRLLNFFFDKNAVKKVMEELVPRYKKITSGFIRIVKLDNRLGDNAKIAMLILKPKDKEDVKDIKEIEDIKDVGGKKEIKDIKDLKDIKEKDDKKPKKPATKSKAKTK